MENLTFFGVLASYGLPAVIIAAADTIIFCALILIFGEKLNGYFNRLFPFVFGVVSAFIYDWCCSGEIIFSPEALYSGLAAGSFSACLVGLINKIRQGKTDKTEILRSLIRQALLRFTEPQIASDASYAITDALKKTVFSSAEVSEEEIKSQTESIIKTYFPNIDAEEFSKIVSAVIGTIKLFR